MQVRAVFLALALACACAIPVHSDPAGPAEAPPAEGGGARASNALNPAISVNALLLGSWRRSDTRDAPSPGDPGDGPPTGIRLEEAELIVSSAVDPYLRADLIVALADAAGGGLEVDLEEAYVTALRMPRGLGLRAGKMKLPFGRHNPLHTHAFPFISAPLVSAQVFGDEGLSEAGLELSYLLPLAWYSQLTAEVVDGRNELFAGSRPQDLAYMGHFKNVVDVSESATVELGASALYGRRGSEPDTGGERSSRVYGLNATYKYRSTRRALDSALEVQGELLRCEGQEGGGVTGGYGHARWQAARRWWLEGRYDRIHRGGADEDRVTGLVAFVPSEFSALRLEYGRLSPYEGPRDHQVLLQLSYSIGSHPAHAY